MTDAPDTLPPGQWRVVQFGMSWEIRAADGGLICFVQSKELARAIAAIPEREREIERLRLLINTDITELSDERDALRARVAELEAALRKVLEAVIAYLPDQPPKTGRAKTSIDEPKD